MFLEKIEEIYKKIKNIALFYLAFGINSIVPYLLYPHLIKILGEESFGTILYIQSIGAILGAVIEYGFSISATRELSQRKNDDKFISGLLGEVVYSKVLLTVVVFVVSYIVYLYSNVFSQNEYYFIFSYLLGISTGWSFLWFFQGINQGSVIVIIESISKLFLLGLTLYFVNDKTDISIALILQICTAVVPNILGFLLLFNRFKEKPNLSLTNAVRKLYDTKYSFYFRISAIIHANMPLIFLGLIADKTSVAYYGTCYKLTKNAIANLINPFWQAIFPKFSELKKNNIERYLFFSKRIKILHIVVGTIGALLVFFTSGTIISLFFTIQSITVVNTFKVLSFSIIFVLIAYYYININLIEGREKEVFYVTLINILCLFIVMFIFSYYKSVGAALATIIADILLIITLIIIRKKNA